MSETTCPMPVAQAAPAIPMAGIGPKPKIMIGSSTILTRQPISMLIIETFMRPIAWNIFS